MPRYIDADVLVNQMLSHYRALVDEYGERDAYISGYDAAIDTIQIFPTADVVEVVRCKDCVHCREYMNFRMEKYLGCNGNGEIYKVSPTHFCSYGERKDETAM